MNILESLLVGIIIVIPILIPLVILEIAEKDLI